MNQTQIANEYRAGASYRELIKKYKKSFRSLAAILKSEGVEPRVSKRKAEDFFRGELVTFNGRQYFPNHKGYMRARSDPRNYLHRDVFEFFSKRKIKPGHEVNHRDHNKLNWLFCNLEEIDHDEHVTETANWLKENGPGPKKFNDEVPF